MGIFQYHVCYISVYTMLLPWYSLNYYCVNIVVCLKVKSCFFRHTQWHGVFHSTMVLLCWRNTEIVRFCVVALICVCVCVCVLTGIGTSSCCVGSTVFLSNSFMMVLLNCCLDILSCVYLRVTLIQDHTKIHKTLKTL